MSEKIENAIQTLQNIVDRNKDVFQEDVDHWTTDDMEIASIVDDCEKVINILKEIKGGN